MTVLSLTTCHTITSVSSSDSIILSNLDSIVESGIPEFAVKSRVASTSLINGSFEKYLLAKAAMCMEVIRAIYVAVTTHDITAPSI